jgi:hypothetical protein
VRRAGRRAAVGALNKTGELFNYSCSRDAYGLLRAAAAARPGGAADEGPPEPEFVEPVTEAAARGAEDGQPWVALAVQPLVTRWLRRLRRRHGYAVVEF